VPDKPVPENDPITTKSYAGYYLIAMVLLIATLFWALWDEAYGQRPWKAYQETWKDRYTAFLKTAKSKSNTSVKDVEGSSDYQALVQAYKQALADSDAQSRQITSQLRDVNGRLLAVRSVFTDRRAYVNAITYEIETDDSQSGKASKKKDLDKYEAKLATVEFPDGSHKRYNFHQLEEQFTEINEEKNKLSLQLGTVLKPVTEAKAKMDQYVTDHMVDLTPAQIAGLQ
jgi:predicted  nucleic acid-binding Zn-ribbon protein